MSLFDKSLISVHMGGPALIQNIIYEEFDNFYICNIVENGVVFPTTEHYFQSKKDNTDEYQMRVLDASSGMDAWRVGQTCDLRSDWDTVKKKIMYDANFIKFSQYQELADKLIKTKGTIKFPQSDYYWGSDGYNWLGIILEAIRAKLSGNMKRFNDLYKYIEN